MTPRRIPVTILCIALVLLAGAVSGGEPGTTADGRTTLRASTAAEAGTLIQVAADAPAAGGQPSWMGLMVLVFGVLLAVLWIGAVVFTVMRAIREARSPGRVGPTRVANQSRQGGGMTPDRT